MPLVHAIASRGRGRRLSVRWGGLALGSLAALLAAAVLALTPAGAQSPELPPDLGLQVHLVEDSDNIVPAGGALTAGVRMTLSGNYNGAIEAHYDQRFGVDLGAGGLRLSGPYNFDATGGQYLALGGGLRVGNSGLTSRIEDALTGRSPAMGNPELMRGPDRGIFQAVAWDERTLVGRSWGIDNTVNDRVVQIFDTSTTPPTWRGLLGSQEAGRNASWHRFGTGFDEASLTPGFSSVAVWHEDEDTAWLFVGAEGTRANGTTGHEAAGALYVYKLEYAANGDLTIGTGTSWDAVMRPPTTETRNRYPIGGWTGHRYTGRYGSSVAISADGSTLVVSARRMNHVGAAYVYTRPSSAGGWADVDYDDGVKVSAVAIPSWGQDANTTRPFDSTSASGCPANSYCARVTAQITRNGNHHHLQEGVEFGIGQMGISADGRVIVIGAPGKQLPASTPGGSFTGDDVTSVDQGEVYIFEAPAGGWNSVPDYTAGKTEVTANANASGFDPDMHYSPGPDKRVVEPTATLRPSASWDGPAENFGTLVDISADGSTVAVASGTGAELESWFGSWADNPKAYIFERGASASWQSSTTPAATFNLAALGGGDNPSWWSAWGFDLHPDGGTLLLGQKDWNEHAGRALVFKKGDGWTDQEVSEANSELPTTPTLWQLGPPQGKQPNDNRTRFGAPLYDLDGQRLAISSPGWRHDNSQPGRVWLVSLGTGSCPSRTLDGVTSIGCVIPVADGRVEIPPGTPEGTFTISGEFDVRPLGSTGDPEKLRGALTVTIGTVDEVASASLGLATDLGDPTLSGDDKPYPSTLKRRGDSTRLLLSVLNANGKASARGSVSSVLVTTSAGRLGLLDNSLAGAGSCAGGLSCQLDVSKVTAANADRLVFTLTHGGRAGAATVRATVFSRAGGTYMTDPVEVTLAGPAESISIGAATRSVLNVDAGAAGEDGTVDDSTDTRDRLLLAVTAVDAAGVSVDVPENRRRTWITDSEGKRVTSGVTATFPHLGADGEPALTLARSLQAAIEVNRSAADPLPAGEYTLTVTAGGKTATQTFTATGGPASDGITISDPGSPTVNETFSVTVTVKDAEGNAVPDGTMVTWAPLDAMGVRLADTVLAVQRTATTLTKDGQVTAEYLAIDAGSIVIKVTSGSAAATRRVDLQPVPRQPSEDPTDDLTNRNPAGFSVWLGVGETSASALLSRLSGPNTLGVWMDGEWRYYTATASGAVGEDFAVMPGTLLWVDLR